MWIYTTLGFISAVEDKKNPDLLLVRSRDREALELVLDQIELAGAAEGPDGRPVEVLGTENIIEGAGTDYRYRVVMTRGTFAVFLQHYVLNLLDYKNFKDALTASRGKVYHDVAFDVWNANWALDDRVGELAPDPEAVGRRKAWR